MPESDARSVVIVPKPFVGRLQWRNQFRQSLEEGAGRRCSECESAGGLEQVAVSSAKTEDGGQFLPLKAVVDWVLPAFWDMWPTIP